MSEWVLKYYKTTRDVKQAHLWWHEETGMYKVLNDSTIIYHGAFESLAVQVFNSIEGLVEETKHGQ